MEMQQSTRRHHQIIGLYPLVDISGDELARRVKPFGLKAKELQRRIYVGSTTSPQWRWSGGHYWRSESKDSQPQAEPDYMPGHRLKWKSMWVLGSWQDKLCKVMEVQAIAAAREVAGAWCQNIASDARGLSDRGPYAWAFVYVCADFY